MNERLLSFQDRLLCSSRDAVKEAKSWCDMVLAAESQQIEDINVSHYWVVGMGAGYHLEELARRRSHSVISVIEHRPEIIETFKSWGASLRGQLIIENVQNSSDLFSSKSFQIYGLELSRILTFKPCLQGSEAWAQMIQQDLLGKSAKGFNVFSQLLKFPISLVDETNLSLLPINIKSIDSFFDGGAPSEEKMICSILKELVR